MNIQVNYINKNNLIYFILLKQQQNSSVTNLTITTQRPLTFIAVFEMSFCANMSQRTFKRRVKEAIAQNLINLKNKGIASKSIPSIESSPYLGNSTLEFENIQKPDNNIECLREVQFENKIQSSDLNVESYTSDDNRMILDSTTDPNLDPPNFQLSI